VEQMIRVEALENFTFARYGEIEKTLKCKANKQEGRIFAGDIFECDKEIADYLLGDNPIKRAVVKVIEVVSEKKKEEDEPIKEKITKKTTKSKKTIAKK
jgi:hypothetical protein